MADNPLDMLISLLSQQAGPRGSTFAGRVIPKGQNPSLEDLLARLPTESPDAEGMGSAALLAAGSGQLLLSAPKPFMKLGKQPVKGFSEEMFKYELPVRVTLPTGETFDDVVKGLNRGHAFARARSNWEGLPIELLPKEVKK